MCRRLLVQRAPATEAETARETEKASTSKTANTNTDTTNSGREKAALVLRDKLQLFAGREGGNMERRYSSRMKDSCSKNI